MPIVITDFALALGLLAAAACSPPSAENGSPAEPRARPLAPAARSRRDRCPGSCRLATVVTECDSETLGRVLMKFHIDVDVSADELRKLLGLPDLDGLQQRMLDDFWDGASGGFYSTTADTELPVRPKELWFYWESDTVHRSPVLLHPGTRSVYQIP